MKQLLLSILLLFSFNLFAQTITTNPAFPTPDAPVTLTFYAEGTPLEGNTGDLYTHTGVTIEGVGTWQYVIGSWGNNTTQPKFTRIDTDVYELEITPSINDFYSVPDGKKVIGLCLVIRNSASNAQTVDLFIDVYEPVLSVNLVAPEGNQIVPFGSEIDVFSVSSYATQMILYLDGTPISQTTNDSLQTTLTVTTYGKHWIKVEAKDATYSVFDSVFYYVRDEITVAELPTGTKKGINYISDESVTLVLHAPEKEFVYLLGDFNDWDLANTLTTSTTNPSPVQVTATTWMMNKTPDGNYFWFTLKNITPGYEYAYQYLVDGSINVADPYTDKILDPWNDGYISDATYPNLKDYPAGKTTQAVSVFQTQQEPYEWEVENFTPPAVTDMVVYEMHIRDYVATHSFKTITDTLDYLQNLGINVLELMPVNEFEGNSSWGYNPSFYFAPDKYYGPKNDLKKLIDECHKRGIAVVIDLVLNHTYGQSPMVRMYFENGKPSADNPWYNVTSNFQNPDAQWGYDFNHESEHTKAFVDSVNTYWLTHYKVDGFRFDFTKGFSNTVWGPSDWGSTYDASRIAILKRMTNKIKEVNPNTYVIFEHLADNSEEKELANYGILLWGNLNYNYCEASMGWTSTSDFSWISYQKRGWNDPHVVGYMESHDEERMMYKNLQYGNAGGDYSVKNLNTALSRIELTANFFLTIPGPKMIWQFGELGYDVSIDYNGRVGEKPIKWDYLDVYERQRVHDVYASLAKIRVEEPAFETDDYTLSVAGATKSIHLNHTEMNVVVLGNFGVTTASINPDFQQIGIWYEFYTGETFDVTDTQANISLAPGEYRLYTTKQLDTPIIGNVFDQKGSFAGNQQLEVYPNPASSVLFINHSQPLIQVSVYNLVGQKVLENAALNGNKLSISELKNGIYLMTATDPSGYVYTARFVKN